MPQSHAEHPLSPAHAGLTATEHCALDVAPMGVALAARVQLLEHLACGSLADAGTAASARSYLLARMLAEEALALTMAGASAERLSDALVRHRRLEGDVARSIDTGILCSPHQSAVIFMPDAL